MVRKDIADRWVAALRSGEYRQGKGALRIGDEFCCLGVLCDIVKDDVGVEWDGGWFDGAAGLLTGLVLSHTGMRSAMGDRGGKRLPLTERNDRGASFSTIAKIIEQEWETL